MQTFAPTHDRGDQAVTSGATHVGSSLVLNSHII